MSKFLRITVGSDKMIINTAEISAVSIRSGGGSRLHMSDEWDWDVVESFDDIEAMLCYENVKEN